MDALPAFNASAPAPNLYLSRDEWSRLGERLQDPFFAVLYERVLRTLEHACARQSDEARRPAQARHVKLLIQHAAVAWHIDRNRLHLDSALTALDRLCEEDWAPTHSTGIREADLRTGENMYTVAFAFDAFYTELSEERRRRCVQALLINGLARYFRGIEARDWWYNCDFNWNSALHGNAGIAALAVREHAPDIAARALAAAKSGLPYMIDACFTGGGWTEGLMYFGTALCHLLDFVYALHRHTGEDLGLFTNRNLRDTLDFVLAMHGGDGEVYNFSDCSEGRRGWVRPHTFWYADKTGRADWAGNQERTILSGDASPPGAAMLFSDIDAFWYRRPFQAAETRDIRGLHHFRGIDWVSWRGERSWLAFRGGYNGGNHNNLDLGHFILGLGSTRYLIDPGYGAKATDMHNCPLMRFKEQTECATAPILRCEETAEGFYLLCDLREAFPHALERYDRHLLLHDDRFLVVVDDIGGRGAIRNDAQFNLQTALPARVSEEGFAIEGPEATLRVIVSRDTRDRHVEPWVMGRGNRTINRLKWFDSYFRVHSVQPVVMTTAPDAVSTHIEGSRVVVNVGDRNCGILLRE